MFFDQPCELFLKVLSLYCSKLAAMRLHRLADLSRVIENRGNEHQYQTHLLPRGLALELDCMRKRQQGLHQEVFFARAITKHLRALGSRLRRRCCHRHENERFHWPGAFVRFIGHAFPQFLLVQAHFEFVFAFTPCCRIETAKRKTPSFLFENVSKGKHYPVSNGMQSDIPCCHAAQKLSFRVFEQAKSRRKENFLLVNAQNTDHAKVRHQSETDELCRNELAQ
jgi:hypothetical protein